MEKWQKEEQGWIEIEAQFSFWIFLILEYPLLLLLPLFFLPPPPPPLLPYQLKKHPTWNFYVELHLWLSISSPWLLRRKRGKRSGGGRFLFPPFVFFIFYTWFHSDIFSVCLVFFFFISFFFVFIFVTIVTNNLLRTFFFFFFCYAFSIFDLSIGFKICHQIFTSNPV